jgi:hypothetical protein
VKDLLVGRSLNGVALRCMHKGGNKLIHSEQDIDIPSRACNAADESRSGNSRLQIRTYSLSYIHVFALAYAMYHIFMHSQSLTCICPPPPSANTRVLSSYFSAINLVRWTYLCFIHIQLICLSMLRVYMQTI